jgi:hypothetical protein
MAGTATMNRPGTGTAPQGGKQPAAPPQVFRVGVYETDTPDIDVTLAATAAAQKLGTFKISPNGWLSGIWCFFQLTVTGGTYTASGDNPWSGIQKVTFRDVGNREIVGPLTGYEWFVINKYGGYWPGSPDPRTPVNGYQNPGTSGSVCQFMLYLPLEIVYRDTLGEIENKSSSSSYTLEIYIDSMANTFGGGTFTGISWRFRGNLQGYTEPEPADSRGRPFSQAPPAAGTVQYWASEIWVAVAGINRYNQQNGIGYAIRNIIDIAYDNANGTRATGWNFSNPEATGGDWPDPFTLAFGKVQLFQRPAPMWQNLMARWYGWYTASLTSDAAGAPENGVFAQPFNREFDTIAGNELRNGYLITKAGNTVQGSGTFVLAANVHVLTNYIVPPGNDAARLRAR